MDINRVLEDSLIKNAIERGIVSIKGGRITYHLNQEKSYVLTDPEEQVRARTIAFLILNKHYSPKRMRTEVEVPRRTPNDFADIVVYAEESCKTPYLVVENKHSELTSSERLQGIEQLFGNANSLRANLGLYDDGKISKLYDIQNYPATERKDNIKGNRDSVPINYGNVPKYTYIAGPNGTDITPVSTKVLESKVKRAHSTIWAGGKRDPLQSFDEWSKLMLAKVEDERNTPNGEPRKFQIGTGEPASVVATRIHTLFKQAIKVDSSIFPPDSTIQISDNKIFEIVGILQDISITDTTVDNIGMAFEIFFGSVFRGELGQYFTMRPIARFTVSMLDINHNEYVIDPTCGSGGFLLEVLLQVWNNIEVEFAGRSELNRIKTDFALQKVYGIEIHEILARICKINLLLHHDGHTNIEGDRSCLSLSFTKPRLQQISNNFDVVVGNPPFGDSIKDGDEDQLGKNSLNNFVLGKGKTKIESEIIILEKAINMLVPGGRLGFVLPDGVLNNQGKDSATATREYLVRNGKILAVVSLPDYAFRRSGAQNKTSVLFFQKFTNDEKQQFDSDYEDCVSGGAKDPIYEALCSNSYRVFFSEASNIGYTTTGLPSKKNDLYNGEDNGKLATNQDGSILGDYRSFISDPNHFMPTSANTSSLSIEEIWSSHSSHRLDPKYHLFKLQERQIQRSGWISRPITELMTRRLEQIHPEDNPDVEVTVLTISQTGTLRRRAAGKGNNPPEWLGMYFEDSPSKWFVAHEGDVVYSGIDLWKGCIAVVPKEFDGAIVTKEYPVYRITNDEIDPDFLAILLRSRYYMRAFRAITTGHSNRRRTQEQDFELLIVSYPADKQVQRNMIKAIIESKEYAFESQRELQKQLLLFDAEIDQCEEDQGDVRVGLDDEDDREP
ncbi:MAG: hypothetical protein E7Z70_01910 [Thermoplasmata archaeon]|nr:hypothetical protein [Thermoplasmata archaeon]